MPGQIDYGYQPAFDFTAYNDTICPTSFSYVPTFFKVNITNKATTVINTGYLFDFQSNGGTRLRLDTNGGLLLSGGNGTGGGLSLTGPFQSYSIYDNSSCPWRNDTWGCIGSTDANGIRSVVLNQTTTISWSSNNQWYNGTDVMLLRDTAKTLAIRNSTNAMSFSVYNTYTDASNYERGIFDFRGTSNVLRIATEAAGTGTVRNISLMGGNVGIGTTSPSYPLDISGAFRWGTNAGSYIYYGASAYRFAYADSGAVLLYSGPTAFSVRKQDDSAELFRIMNNTGNVGIGTTSPGQKLTVSGTIESTSGGVKFPDGTTQNTATKLTTAQSNTLSISSISNNTSYQTVISCSITVTGSNIYVIVDAGWKREGGSYTGSLNQRLNLDSGTSTPLLSPLSGTTNSQQFDQYGIRGGGNYLFTGLSAGSHTITYDVSTSASADTWTTNSNYCKLILISW